MKTGIVETYYSEGLSSSVVKKIGDDKLIKLIERYEKELKEGDYSIVDGSTELERVIKDLKKLKEIVK